ncbi:GyrI-like domain-containing protein [uncultured Maribacter sp.]|uniref:GyrI-like domain-containing protein n=1 Tax=uncultured Maribacter sp. TaxID=431308 RepID=UPI00260727A2|nr:GyrI-like domain-containing protein [uncultured Maribacter sp.]
MPTKHEWRKAEKALYLPKTKPELIEVSAQKFITISGAGNPNSQHFANCVSVLYPISYAIKMNAKKMKQPSIGYFDYTVYPLEGLWDLNEEAKKRYNGTLNKDDLVFKLMIRQPDFVSQDFFSEMLALTKKKKPHSLLENLKFETITDGKCIQMMHIGHYDDEPKSFKLMEQFALEQGVERLSKAHREIYLSDFRKVAPEKLKTVLRFQLKN